MKFLGSKRVALALFLLPDVGVLAQNVPSTPVRAVAASGSTLVSDVVNPVTGALRQAEVITGPYNLVAADPRGRFVYVAGGATGSTLYGGTIDALNAALTPIPKSPYPLPGAITSVAVEAVGRFLYVGSSSGVQGARINPLTGALTPIPGSPFPVTRPPLAMVSDSAGKYLYAVADRVRAWAINVTTGALTPAGGSGLFDGAASGRGLAIDPQNRFLFAGTTSGIYGYAIKGATLTPLAGSPFYAGNVSKSVSFDGTGKFLYVTQNGTRELWGFAVDAASGNLTPVPGSPFWCTPACTGVTGDALGKHLYAMSYDAQTGGSLAYNIDSTTGSLTYIDGVAPRGTSIALVPAAGALSATLQSLQIIPPNPTVTLGLNQQFTATGAYSDETQRFLSSSVSWSSSNTSVATISNVLGQSGLATTTGSGSTIISATLQGMTATTTLTVQ